MLNGLMLKKLLRDYLIPPGILRILQSGPFNLNAYRFRAGNNDYDAERYWSERHEKYGANRLRGAGHTGLTEEENIRWYRSARIIFERLLDDIGIDETSRVLEIGFGSGFYTRLMHDRGVSGYQGIDITDVLIASIIQSIPGFSGELFKLNAGVEIFTSDRKKNLIFMIDVTQHIVNDAKLSFLIFENVDKNLLDGGHLILTDNLSDRKVSYYEKGRELSFYQERLKNYSIVHEPILFRDKYIFSLKKIAAIDSAQS